MRSGAEPRSRSPARPGPDPARPSPRPPIGWCHHASAPPARTTNEGSVGRGLGRGGQARRRASIGWLGDGRSRCLRRPRRRDEPQPPVPPAEAGAAVRSPGRTRPGRHHGELGTGGGPTGRWAGARGRGDLGRGAFGSRPGQEGTPDGRLRVASRGLGGLGHPRPLAPPAGARRTGGARWAGNPGSRAAGRHRPSPAPCSPGPRAVASQTGGRAPWLPALCPPGAALGHRRGRKRSGMGRTAAGSPGRRGQRRRLPGRRRRRRVPPRRKAGACGRKRARPRRKEPRLERAGQAALATCDSGCGADSRDPVRAGPPHPPLEPPGGVPNPLWVSVSSVKCALQRKRRAPSRRRSSQFFLVSGTWFSWRGSAWESFLWGPRAGRWAGWQ